MEPVFCYILLEIMTSENNKKCYVDVITYAYPRSNVGLADPCVRQHNPVCWKLMDDNSGFELFQ